MMRRCYKGNTYLVKANKHWWILQQTGQRSWDAVIFSHANPFGDVTSVYRHGNSESIVEGFKDSYSDLQFYVFRNDKDLRMAMFDVLKYGKMTEGVNEV